MRFAAALSKISFNSERVIAALDRATRAAMSRFGAFVRRRARSSIRKAKSPSEPGKPPHGHGQQLLHKGIQFGYDTEARSVVIGPMPLSGMPAVSPKRLEEGGRVARQPNRRRRPLGIGKIGPIRMARRKPVFTKLVSERQVARAAVLATELYGPETIEGTVAARPFMGPAFRAELPEAADMWANSVVGA